MENQQSYQCFNNQLCRRQYKVKPKQMGGQRIVQSQIHFIIIIFLNFFYNPGRPCRSLKAECKANCLNKPDYRY